MSSSSAEIFAPLYNFLKTSSLDKITTSSVITQQWNCFKIQSENEDFDCLMKILKDMENEINDDKRKQHLKSLQNINQCSAIEKATYCQRESLSLYLR
uniref:Uncharacterized protein n=1 Tax=Rhizophagus irregularis (strain DAOM 181602 / DAOM 197198 / MUCL 43194) TaxID=747089 RepID=U9UG10_RHIID